MYYLCLLDLDLHLTEYTNPISPNRQITLGHCQIVRLPFATSPLVKPQFCALLKNAQQNATVIIQFLLTSESEERILHYEGMTACYSVPLLLVRFTWSVNELT